MSGAKALQTHYERVYEASRLKVGRAVLGHLTTGQEFYGWRVQVDTQKPRYFKSENGYNGDRAKAYVEAAFSGDRTWLGEVRCIRWQNWEDSR